MQIYQTYNLHLKIKLSVKKTRDAWEETQHT